MTYITIREHRYSKLEIPTQYFQEHFASFPKIIFQSFESALNFALNAHFFCDFHTPCFRPVLCRFFSFFYNFICIQWISLVKNPLSVFPIACVSLRKEIIYATKKFTLPLNAKLQAKCQNNFSTFFMTLKKHSQLSTYFGVVSSETSL